MPQGKKYEIRSKYEIRTKYDRSYFVLRKSARSCLRTIDRCFDQDGRVDPTDRISLELRMIAPSHVPAPCCQPHITVGVGRREEALALAFELVRCAMFLPAVKHMSLLAPAATTAHNSLLERCSLSLFLVACARRVLVLDVGKLCTLSSILHSNLAFAMFCSDRDVDQAKEGITRCSCF